MQHPMTRRLIRRACFRVVPFVVWASVVSPFILHARANASDIAFTNPAFAVHLAHLKKTVPKGFTVVVQPPFVVIGDEPPEMVRRRATNTVKWAVDKLKQDYFKRDPAEIIDIWLFRDQDSYTIHARLLFNDTPTTPFGYYSAKHQALIMKRIVDELGQVY